MKKIVLATLFLLTIIFVAGCGPTTGTGQLVLQITDQPSQLNIEKALVTISQVQVHLAGEEEEDLAGEEEEVMEEPDNETNETMMEESQAGWFTIVEEEQTFDLIQIKDVTEFLGTADLQTGKYTQIRLSLDKALVTIDGEEYDLTVPSSKIKLTQPFTLEENQTTTLTLDFDAQESIHAAGNKYILRPTIKVIQE